MGVRGGELELKLRATAASIKPERSGNGGGWGGSPPPPQPSSIQQRMPQSLNPPRFASLHFTRLVPTHHHLPKKVQVKNRHNPLHDDRGILQPAVRGRRCPHDDVVDVFALQAVKEREKNGRIDPRGKLAHVPAGELSRFGGEVLGLRELADLE